MAEVVKMPRLSDTMEEGTVAKWHKKVGDKVSEGDLLAEIETDKATMDFEAFQEGVLLYIGTEEGQTAPVESILAILGEKGEDIQPLLSGGSPETIEASAETKKEEAPKESAEKPNASEVATNDARIKISPLAKKLASDKGIDITSLQGSGENGRIVKKDIDNYSIPSAQNKPAPVISSGESETIVVNQMRKTIARRLSDSKFSAPHFYLTMDIDMDHAIEARKNMNAILDSKVSFNDFVVKASAMALRKHPAINSSWNGDTITRHADINIGVAVAVEDGLLVPVIRQADQTGLASINTQVKELAAKARDKKLHPSEWEGNTFTISNLGMYDVESFTSIINAPDSCIMAIGGIKAVPVVKNGAVVPGNVMKVTLSCDHRVVDGVTGAKFLQTFKAMMENPMMKLV